LTLSAVALKAGISRPTVYRWFPTKSDLVAAIVAYEEMQFDIGIREAIGMQQSPQRRLDAVLSYLFKYLDDSVIPSPISADPSFSLQSLAKGLGHHVEVVVCLLADDLDEVPAVRSGTLSRKRTAELFLRLAYSHYLVPHLNADALLASVRSLAGIEGPVSP
jgi:AcrR family transcriptional regulator